MDIDACYELLPGLVTAGELDIKYVDLAVRRILYVKFALGLFDAPVPPSGAVATVVHSPAHVALARQLAEESAVLLQNRQQILPLDPARFPRIAVVGPNSHTAVFGDYCWAGRDGSRGVNLYQGLQNIWGDKVTLLAAEGCDWWSQDTNGIAAAVAAVRASDVAIVALGTRSTYLGRSPDKSTAGEAFDLSSLELPGVQQQLLTAVAAVGKPVIVVLISGKPLAVPWVKAHADAFVVQWYGGEQQGQALAEILTGVVNPSGRLNVSFPRSTGNTPCFYNHYPTDRNEPFDQPGSPAQPGGHYVFDTPEPLWAFGEGLSYTDFKYEACRLESTGFHSNDVIRVVVKVANTGPRAGQEVVQLYVRRLVSSVATPVQELKAFKKIALAPGEAKDVELLVPVEQLRWYIPGQGYVIEPGNLELQIGHSSREIAFIRTVKLW